MTLSVSRNPAPPSPADDLQSLRARVDKLSTTIVRFVLVQLTALGLLVFALAGAFAQGGDASLADQLEVVRGLRPATGETAWTLHADPLSHFVGFRSFLAPQETTATDDSLADSVRTLLKEHPELLPAKGDTELIQLPQPAGDPVQPLSAAEKKLATTVQLRVASSLRQKYAEAFGLQLGLLGGTVRIDLRNWLAFLPFGVILSLLYLSILRTKENLYETIAARQVAIAGGTAAVASVDRLDFSDRWSASTWKRHPRQLGSLLYAAALLGLLGFLVRAAVPWWRSLEDDGFLVWLTASLVGVVASCAINYHQYCARAMASAVRRSLGVHVRPTGVAAAWIVLRRRMRGMTSGRYATRRLVAGGVLVLISLGLPLGIDSCGDPTPGYRVVAVSAQRAVSNAPLGLDKNEEFAWWIPSFSLLAQAQADGYADQEAIRMGLAEQDVAIGLLASAILTAVWALISAVIAALRRRRARPWRWVVFLGGLAATLLSLDLWWLATGPLTRVTLVVLAWLVPWTMFACRSRSAYVRRCWVAARELLVVAYLPVVVSGAALAMFPSEKGRLWGLLCLIVGVNLQWAGLRGAAKRATADSTRGGGQRRDRVGNHAVTQQSPGQQSIRP